jgi:antitoxin (DNA-binding transcriptional repressor) of toxin-antitoxin stability system
MKTSAAKTIAVGQAKTHLLSLVTDTHENGTTHVLTKRGKVVAHIVPPPKPVEETFRPLWGRSKGRMTIKGDIISPACPEEDWEALAD